jgi:hypothetical protein
MYSRRREIDEMKNCPLESTMLATENYNLFRPEFYELVEKTFGDNIVYKNYAIAEYNLIQKDIDGVGY